MENKRGNQHQSYHDHSFNASFRFIRLRLFAVASCLVIGCATQEKTQDVLRVLQEGKARGHLVMTTDGRLSAGQTITFFAGANSASISFDGDIDFADTVRHVSDDNMSIETANVE